MHLFLKGSMATKRNPPAFEIAEAQQVVEEQKGELSLEERLRCRIRYFSEGVILGSCSLSNLYCQRLKQKLGYKRKTGPTPIKAFSQTSLWVFRNLRVRKFG